jgi:hypothetical protein
MVKHTCNPSIQEAEAGDGELETAWSIKRDCVSKTTTIKEKTPTKMS